MKKTIIKMAIIAFVGFVVSGWQAAADSGVKQEADKGDAIKRIMARKTFYPGEPEKPFCRQFFEDFRILKNMSFVEPVARAKHYDDPVLELYKARCRNLPLIEYFACEPGVFQNVEWSEDSREKRQQLLRFCRRYAGTTSFRVYELDIDGDAENGEELIVYFERTIGRDFRGDNVYWNGGYNVFDSRSCAVIAAAPTHDPYSYSWKRPLDNHNGILFYRDRYYIFDLYDLDGSDRDAANPNYSLQVSTVGPDRSHWCSYSTEKLPSRLPRKSLNPGGSK